METTNSRLLATLAAAAKAGRPGLETHPDFVARVYTLTPRVGRDTDNMFDVVVNGQKVGAVARSNFGGWYAYGSTGENEDNYTRHTTAADAAASVLA